MSLPPFAAHVDVWLIFGSITAAYFISIRRHERSTGEVTEKRRIRFFVAGMAVMWIAADWPIHDLAENYLFSVHMLQHMMFSMVAVPLQVSGMPAWMWRKLISPAPIHRAWAFLTKPLVAMIGFNGFLLFMHWPAVVEASVTSGIFHFSLHVLLVGWSAVMWWPIFSPLAELPPLRAPGQMVYLFMQSLTPTIPASFLTFGTKPLYPIYATFPRIWGFSAINDQQIAGLIMKLVGGIILWIMAGVVFFHWYEREKTEGWDDLKWHDVDREIQSGVSVR